MTRRITIHIDANQARVLEALARHRQHSLSAELRLCAARHIEAESQAINENRPRELAAGAGDLGYRNPVTEEAGDGP